VNVRPYGDATNDGAMQLSFTLPVSLDDRAEEAARALARRCGIEDPYVAHATQMSPGYSFFVVYGRCVHSVNLDDVKVVKAEKDEWSFQQVNTFIKEKVGRPVVVVGACIGDDAHTVGIDAILDMKGCHGHVGLERYPMFAAHNLGAQVKSEELVAKALKLEADALLVSKVVTQKGIHLHDLTRLVELLEAEGLRQRFLLIAGGPKIDHRLAQELGFDAGFGKGTTPTGVATYLAREMAVRSAR
jgi:beta-lysine 5,6-aminomutase beta subunit